MGHRESPTFGRMEVEDTDFEPSDIPQRIERGPEDYEYYLGLPLSAYKDKRILNIGSGVTGLFDKAIAKQGAKVFPMSPFLGFSYRSGMNCEYSGSEKMRKDYKQGMTLHRLKKRFGLNANEGDMYPIGARVENLPIALNSMDYVIALYSVPLYLDIALESQHNIPESYPKLFSDILNVTKSTGKGIFYPVPEGDKKMIQEILEKLPNSTFVFIPVKERKEEDVVFPGQISYRLEITKDFTK